MFQRYYYVIHQENTVKYYNYKTSTQLYIIESLLEQGLPIESYQYVPVSQTILEGHITVKFDVFRIVIEEVF